SPDLPAAALLLGIQPAIQLSRVQLRNAQTAVILSVAAPAGAAELRLPDSAFQARQIQRARFPLHPRLRNVNRGFESRWLPPRVAQRARSAPRAGPPHLLAVLEAAFPRASFERPEPSRPDGLQVLAHPGETRAARLHLSL